MSETINLISKTIPSILIYQVRAQNQLRIKCIQGRITKPTQNQVYSRQNHKTNSESSVFKPKSAPYTRDKKKLISKTITKLQMHWKIIINTALKFVTNN